MATAELGFVEWLGSKLKYLNADENIFTSYITGILESDDSTEEKQNTLEDLLSEIMGSVKDSEITQTCNEIMDTWLKFKTKEPPPCNDSLEDVDVKLAKLLESQCHNTVKQKRYTEEEKKIREAILSQYSQMTDDEGDDSVVAAGHVNSNGLTKNTNALAVQQAEKERREQAKIDSQKKKEKDKEDREKQKQMREEKKEKRKTQKGERRR